MQLAPQHMVYTSSIAESFDFYFNPLVPEDRNGILFLDFSEPGRLQTYAKSGVQFEMASFPEEEDAIEGYFRWYRPKAGDRVFDMGAHCGVSTYHLSKLVGTEGKVIAFEPDPINFAILERNVKRHALENVTIVNAAIAGQTGKLLFNSEGTIGSALLTLFKRDSVGQTVAVDAWILADVFERWGVPDFCKIDIEGAEVEVLQAATKVLTQYRTNFAIDTNHPKLNGRTTERDVEDILQRCGYEVKSIADHFLLPGRALRDLFHHENGDWNSCAGGRWG